MWNVLDIFQVVMTCGVNVDQTHLIRRHERVAVALDNECWDASLIRLRVVTLQAGRIEGLEEQLRPGTNHQQRQEVGP